MPGARWFPDARLNYAENLLRERDAAPAITFWGEDRVKRRLSKRQLYDLVSRIAQALADAGVKKGDRVAGYLPNVPEATAALLATASLGAVGRAARPTSRAGRARPLRADRAQILFCADGYIYGGKEFDSQEKASQVRRGCRASRSAWSSTISARRRAPAPRSSTSSTPSTRPRSASSGSSSTTRSTLYLGYDRRTEVHRARNRRLAPAAPEGASPAERRQAERPGFSLTLSAG